MEIYLQSLVCLHGVYRDGFIFTFLLSISGLILLLAQNLRLIIGLHKC
jgi:hypothetical protein